MKIRHYPDTVDHEGRAYLDLVLSFLPQELVYDVSAFLVETIPAKPVHPRDRKSSLRYRIAIQHEANLPEIQHHAVSEEPSIISSIRRESITETILYIDKPDIRDEGVHSPIRERNTKYLIKYIVRLSYAKETHTQELPTWSFPED